MFETSRSTLKPHEASAISRVKQKLEAAGFAEAGQTGSHIKFAKAMTGGTRTATVPKHREVAAGTLRSTLRQAGIDAEDFDKL